MFVFTQEKVYTIEIGVCFGRNLNFSKCNSYVLKRVSYRMIYQYIKNDYTLHTIEAIFKENS